MRLRIAAFSVVLIALIAGALPAAAAPGQYQAPRKYFLALGDSLAYGFEHAKFLAEAASGHIDPTTFSGYAGDFAVDLKRVRSSIQEINYGCPGETTSSYFQGCDFSAVTHFPLHNEYTGSQEAAALAFLNAHPGQVSPITIDLGANDALGLVDACHFDSTCIAQALPTVLGTIGANLSRTLAELRAAAPRSEIIVMQYYNPLYVVAPGTDLLVGQLNNVIATMAAGSGARLANAFPVINQNPLFTSEAAAVCGLTGMCVPPGGDIHANDTGYALIAGQFWAASGYSQLD
jgi:lysophospholipase L1-like esterase